MSPEWNRQSTYKVLVSLIDGPLTRAQLVELTRMPDDEVGKALGAMVEDQVAVQVGEQFELTDYGLRMSKGARLFYGKPQDRQPPADPAASIWSAISMDREARARTAWDRFLSRRLGDTEREACTDALAEHYGAGRLDSAELSRRTDLVLAAITYGDLVPAFQGLPDPPVFAQPQRRPSVVRWSLFALSVGLSAPVVLFGLIFMLGGRDVTTIGFGVLVTAVPVVWNLLVLYWATGRRRR
jgi:hypothetical protein